MTIVAWILKGCFYDGSGDVKIGNGDDGDDDRGGDDGSNDGSNSVSNSSSRCTIA